MKTYQYLIALLLVVCVFLAYHCINTSKRKPTYEPNPIGTVHDYYHNKMHYKIIVTPQGDVTTINITRDSLLFSKYTYDRHQE